MASSSVKENGNGDYNISHYYIKKLNKKTHKNHQLLSYLAKNKIQNYI